MLELRRWWAARSYLETCCLFCLSAHSPLPPAPRRPRRAARLHPPLAVADGAAGAGDCGGGPLLSALLHDELLWQGGGCNGAGRDAQVVGGKQRCLKAGAPTFVPGGPPRCTLALAHARRALPAAAPGACVLHDCMAAARAAWCTVHRCCCLPACSPTCFLHHPPARLALPLAPTHYPPTPPTPRRRYENCEMRTVVLADEAGAHPHPCPLHFHGGHHAVPGDPGSTPIH